MRWLPFAVLALATLVLQTTFVPGMAIHGIWPNLMFILAVYYCWWGPWPEAAIAAWLLGLAVDLQSLTTAGRIGLHAFLFGGAGWAIIRLRSNFNRDYAVAQFLVTLIAATAVEVLVEICRRWEVSADGWLAAVWWPAVLTALYTAVCAPYLHWLLNRLGRWTGLRPPRKL